MIVIKNENEIPNLFIINITNNISYQIKPKMATNKIAESIKNENLWSMLEQQGGAVAKEKDVIPSLQELLLNFFKKSIEQDMTYLSPYEHPYVENVLSSYNTTEKVVYDAYNFIFEKKTNPTFGTNEDLLESFQQYVDAVEKFGDFLIDKAYERKDKLFCVTFENKDIFTARYLRNYLLNPNISTVAEMIIMSRLKRFKMNGPKYIYTSQPIGNEKPFCYWPGNKNCEYQYINKNRKPKIYRDNSDNRALLLFSHIDHPENKSITNTFATKIGKNGDNLVHHYSSNTVIDVESIDHYGKVHTENYVPGKEGKKKYTFVSLGPLPSVANAYVPQNYQDVEEVKNMLNTFMRLISSPKKYRNNQSLIKQ